MYISYLVIDWYMLNNIELAYIRFAITVNVHTPRNKTADSAKNSMSIALLLGIEKLSFFPEYIGISLIISDPMAIK